jgi:probable rRNA maturation factor
MAVNIEVNNLAKSPVSAGFIKRVAAAVIKGEMDGASGERKIEVSIVLVSRQKIRKINKEYRKVDAATDVLSIAQEDIVDKKSDCPRILGELVVCPQIVASDAKKAKISVEKELAWALVHGILHLLGHDHEKNAAAAEAMRKKEEFYLSKLKLL